MRQILLGYEGYSIGSMWSEAQFSEEITLSIALKALYKRDVIGFLLVRPFLDCGEIMWLAVDSAFRGQGVAEGLWRFFLESHCKFNEIRLEVHESNRSAQSFYQKIGFHQIGVRSRYYADGGDAVLMQIML